MSVTLAAVLIWVAFFGVVALAIWLEGRPRVTTITCALHDDSSQGEVPFRISRLDRPAQHRWLALPALPEDQNDEAVTHRMTLLMSFALGVILGFVLAMLSVWIHDRWGR
jgi:hypothetical protein